MTKSKKKNLIYSLLLALFMATTFLLGGCLYLNDDIAVWEYRGFLVNRIIYTDDIDKYYDESKAVTYMLDDQEETVTSNYAKIMWSAKEGYIDVIVDTNEQPVGFGADGAYQQMINPDGWQQYLLFNNSHIFSGSMNCLVNQGEYVCDDEECYGPADPSGCMCGGSCKTTDIYFTSDTPLQHQEIMERLEITDEQTFWYVEYFDGSTYTYTKVYNDHTHGTHYEPTIGYKTFFWDSLEDKSDEWKSDNTRMVWVDFNELIIDGYDFSVLSDFLDTFDYSMYFDGDAKNNFISHNSNFSYMFSDLPVEKITIKNVTGLGDNVESIASMFENCTNLKTVEFGNLFDNIKPTNISRMFYNCPSLERVDLSSLDTSNVTKMDYMFATPYGLTAEDRELLINDFINDVIVPQFPQLDQTIEYDLDMAAQIMDMSKMEILIALNGAGLNVPITYNECFEYRYQKTLAECSALAKTNANVLEPWFTYNQSLDTQQLVIHFESMMAEAGIEPGLLNFIYEGNLLTNGNRNDYVNYIINDLLIVLEPELDNGTEWTIESLATYKNISQAQLVFDIAYSTGFGIPLTFDEVCLGLYGMSFDEVVRQANTDPSVLYWDEQLDDSVFSSEEVKYILQSKAKIFNSELMTDEELARYNNVSAPTTLGKTKVILGGEGSKFVVPSGVSANLIFAGNRNIGTIVAPVIEDGVSVTLGESFTDGENGAVSTLTSDNASKTLYYYIDGYDYNEDTPPATLTNPSKGGLSNTLKTALIMIGSAVVVVVGIVVVTIVTKRKR